MCISVFILYVYISIKKIPNLPQSTVWLFTLCLCCKDNLTAFTGTGGSCSWSCDQVVFYGSSFEKAAAAEAADQCGKLRSLWRVVISVFTLSESSVLCSHEGLSLLETHFAFKWGYKSIKLRAPCSCHPPLLHGWKTTHLEQPGLWIPAMRLGYSHHWWKIDRFLLEKTSHLAH